MIRQKNTPIPLFKPLVASTTDVDHPEGQTFYDNKIELVSPAYDAVAQGSSHVWLNGTDQSVDLPIQYDLGAELLDIETITSGAGNTISNVSNVSTIHNEVSTGQVFLPEVRNLNLDTSLTYVATYEVEITSGIARVYAISMEDAPLINETIGVGTYTFTQTGSPKISNERISLQFNGNIEFTFDAIVTSSVREVTNTNSYATYYDVDTKAFKTIDSPVGTTYNMTDSFSSYFTTDVPVTEGDRSYLNTNPEALYAMWFGEPVVGLSFSKANMINFYPANDDIAPNAYGTTITNDILYDIDFTESAEILTNGDLSSDTGWTLSGGAVIAGGEFSFTGVEYISQSPTTGTVREEPNVVEIVVSELTSGYIRVYLSSAIGYSANIYKAGTHRFIIYGDSDDVRFYVRADDGLAVGTITSVSLKKITSGYTEIANYTTACRTTLANQQYGASNFAMVQDGTGRATGMGLANTQNFPPYDDSRYASTGWKPSTPKYSIEETVTGELQDFGVANADVTGVVGVTSGTGNTCVGSGIDTFTVHTEVTTANAIRPACRVEVPDFDKTYEVTFTLEVSAGTVNLNYIYALPQVNINEVVGVGTHTFTTVTSAREWEGTPTIALTIDGTTDFTNDYVVTSSLQELTTKTQRTEQRLLTHESDIDLFAGSGSFSTQADFDSFFNDGVVWVWRAGTQDVARPAGTVLSHFYKSVPTVAGTTYTLSSTANITLGDAEYYVGNGVPGTTVGEDYTFIAGADNLDVGVVSVDGDFTFDNLTLTKVEPETKYYIDGIEQTTPPLPDPTVTMSLNRVAKIGYADTIQSRDSEFNVHTEIITPTFVTTGPNLYPNWELINGSHINQDIPTGTLPDGHVLAFNTGDPCNATYNDNGDGSFSYLFNQVQDPARLVLQQTIGYGVFEVGKRYRYQAKVRTVTFNPIATQLRAIHIAAAVDLVIVDADNAMIDEEVGYELKWIDFEVTDSGISRANFRHGCGVWDVLTTAQETIELAIYELTV